MDSSLIMANFDQFSGHSLKDIPSSRFWPVKVFNVPFEDVERMTTVVANKTSNVIWTKIEHIFRSQIKVDQNQVKMDNNNVFL